MRINNKTRKSKNKYKKQLDERLEQIQKEFVTTHTTELIGIATVTAESDQMYVVKLN